MTLNSLTTVYRVSNAEEESSSIVLLQKRDLLFLIYHLERVSINERMIEYDLGKSYDSIAEANSFFVDSNSAKIY